MTSLTFPFAITIIQKISDCIKGEILCQELHRFLNPFVVGLCQYL